MAFKANRNLQVSLLITLVLALQILTFPTFFFLNPFVGSLSAFMSIAQVLSMVGWILLLVAPPFIIGFKQKLGKRYSWFLLVAALLWPFALILVRIAAMMLIGDPAIGYLFKYPIFLFSDIAVPIIYWRMSRQK